MSISLVLTPKASELNDETLKSKICNFTDAKQYLNKLYSLSSAKKIKFIYLLGTDKVDVKKLNNSFVVYQGHHGDFGAEFANVILPGSTFTEKNSTFINTEGKIQNTYKACNPPGFAKEDWKIIAVLGKKLSNNFNYYNINDVRKRLIKENSKIFKNKNNYINNLYFNFGKKGKILNQGFTVAINDFYLTDPISKSSKIMNNCSREFKEK